VKADAAREALVRRGVRLNLLTLTWNSVEGVVAVASGVTAGSVALVGFGVDSGIELAAGLAALWRLRSDRRAADRERADRIAHRLVGASFLVLAGYVACEASVALWNREPPEESRVGIVLAVLSLAVMPVLARAKRRVAAGLASRALEAEATQTSMCMWLSAILLGGLGLHAALGWWWADPIAALAMTPILVREGLEGWRGEDPCGCHGCEGENRRGGTDDGG